MSREITVEHVDTCLGCYLTDHHNRPGEFLVGIPCAGQGLDDALTELAEEIAVCAPDEFRTGAPLFETQCRDALRGIDLSDPDPSSDADNEASDDCRAWFVVRFPVSS